MKYLWFVLVALVIITSAVSAECVQPDSDKTVVTLKDVRLANNAATVYVGVVDRDRFTWVAVPKEANFIVEETGKDGYWRYFRIDAYCDGTNWVLVDGTILKLGRFERSPTPVQLPPTREVKQGDSWKKISKETGIPADSLRAWNGLDRRHVIPGEHLFTAAPPDRTIVRRWEILGGAPAKIPLLKQVEKLKVPDQVRNEWKTMIAATSPDTVWMVSTPEAPLFHDGLCFDYDIVWPKTVCFWKEPETLAPIDSTLALEFPPVDFEGNRYYLYRYLACNNAAFSVFPLELEAETELAERPAIKPPEPGREPIPVVAEIPEKPKAKPWDWVENGTIWLTYERMEPEHGSPQNSGYSGIEWVARPSYESQGFSIVLRSHQDLMDKNYSGQYRGGLRFRLYSRTYNWFVLPEAGGWYQADQLSYYTFTRVHRDTLRMEEKARFFDGYGWYGRVIGLGPGLSYLDAVYRQGNHVRKDLKAEFTGEPWFLYGKAAYGYTGSRERSRNFGHDTVSFPADTMRTQEFRVGLKPWSNLVLYGAWNDWKFESPIWAFRWWGPGAGVEWRLNHFWRFAADFKDFSHARSWDRQIDRRYDDTHWRLYLTARRNW